MHAARGADQRRAFLAGAIDYVLRHGVATLSLRPLAAALGTSDRMLLYYFRSRDNLLTAVLGVVGEQLQDELGQALPSRAVAPAELLRMAWDVLRAPAVEAHLRLYLEVSGLAARGQEPFRSVAAGVVQGWLAWTAARLDVAASQRPAAAAGVLAVLDGLLLVRFVGSDEVAAQAVHWLGDQLDQDR